MMNISVTDIAHEVRDLYAPTDSESLPYVGLEHIQPDSLHLSGLGNSSDTQSTKKKFQSEDILFGTLRPYFRKVVRAKFDGVCSTDITVIRAREPIDTGFLFYLIASQFFIDYATVTSSGTRMPRAKWSVLSQRDWEIPEQEKRAKIAAVLSAYDNLIENNTRRIKILEEMAQVIYREWFVEFRFPGHEGVEMVDSELGLIPQGWEVKKVKEIVKRLKAGQTYKEAEVKDTGKVIVVDQSRADFLGFHENEPDHDASPIDPIIIFGDHTCKMQLMITPFSLGPNVVPFIAKDEMPISYLFFGVSNLVETREYKRHWTELNNKEIAIGDPETREHFADFTSPIFEQIETLRQKNNNLRQTRDLLLPKLISGEIDI